MCGITGFLSPHLDPAQQQHTIDSMGARLHHRGPDSHGTWIDSAAGVALGHTRLAIHDLNPSANQPMISQNERYCLVFNGEIYNFVELRQQLEKESISFCSHSDTEVLLNLCVHKGLHQTLNLISGMFAFALWDKQERTLFLARDRIGKKPLYYAPIQNSFLFASELKALYPHPDFNKEICSKSVETYFEYGCLPGSDTIFKNTFKLLPGHCLRVNPELEIKSIAYSHIHPQPIHDHDILHQTQQRLEAAVKTRMASDVPLGAFLSGGIDSSLITAIMQKESTQPIHTFSIGFENNEFDESVYAEKIAKHLGTSHQTFIVTEEDAQAVIPSLTAMFDEPFADSSAIPTFLLAKLARSHVTVALTGDGGDEVFGGYNRYRYAKMLTRLGYLPNSIRVILSEAFASTTCQAFLKNVLFKNIPQFQQKAQKLAEALLLEDEQVCYEKIVKIFHLTETVPEDDSPFAHDLVSRWQYRDLTGYLTDDVLTKVDRATMAVGLEARSPFLDEQLVSWGLSLPLHYKIKGSQTKWILRELLKTYVPASLFNRPKQGFALPLSFWLKSSLKPWAEHLLFEVQDDWSVVSQGSIEHLWEAHQSNQVDASQKLWTLLMWRAFLSKVTG